MIGRRSIVGLALLSALLFCAMAAQSASAAESKNTTAFTCVKGGGSLDFKDAHCDETTTPGKGEFGHELIPAGKTEIEVTNEKTASSTTAATSLTLKGSLLKTEVHTDCKTVSGTGSIENSGSGTDHKVSGSLTLQASNCVVLKPTKCSVIEPIVWKLNFKGVDGLGPEKNTMGLEFVPEGSNFTEITLQGAECSCKGTWAVAGSAISTGTPAPNAKESGATWRFFPENEMENLKWGGNAVTMAAALTPRMKGGGNPIALTTTT